MTEGCLGGIHNKYFYDSGRACALMEKDANAWAKVLSTLKGAGGALHKLLGGGYAVAKGAKDTFKDTIDLAKSLFWLGVPIGATAGVGYNLAKHSITGESPKEKMNRAIESVFKHKRMEHEDSKWMDDARYKRDNLMRNYKKMTTQDYAAAYEDLVDHLNKRSQE